MSVFGDRLGAGPHVQLLVHAPDVGVDGGHADVQVLSDFLVEESPREQLQDLLFAVR